MTEVIQDTREVDVEIDPGLGFGLRASIVFHCALLAFVILKSLIFPGDSKPFVPALRVDVVGLPDLLKMQKEHVGKLPDPPSAEKEKEPEAKAEETPEPEEMVLKDASKPKDQGKEKEKKAKEQERERTNRIRNALDRIKALNRITDTPVEEPEQIKGNIVSKGTSLSSDAQETDSPGYQDLLRERIRDNWELPVWLERQNLSSKVRITVDSRGNVRSMSFVKTSGHTGFDQAVRDAITKSQPLPVPPKGLLSEALTDGYVLGFPL